MPRNAQSADIRSELRESMLNFYRRRHFQFVLKFFRGGTRATVGWLAGNFIKTGGQRSIRAFFTWFISGNLRIFWHHSIPQICSYRLFLSHADLQHRRRDICRNVTLQLISKLVFFCYFVVKIQVVRNTGFFWFFAYRFLEVSFQRRLIFMRRFAKLFFAKIFFIEVGFNAVGPHAAMRKVLQK